MVGGEGAPEGRAVLQRLHSPRKAKQVLPQPGHTQSPSRSSLGLGGSPPLPPWSSICIVTLWREELRCRYYDAKGGRSERSAREGP